MASDERGGEMGPTTKRRGALLLLIMSSFVLACTKHWRASHHVNRQDKAGSAHISVLSVAHWDDYSKALQPTFKVSEDDALRMSVTATQAEEDKLIDALQAALALAPPTSASSL